MNTLVSNGKSLEVAAPVGGYTSGQPVLLGAIVGISHSKYLQGETAVIWLVGTHSVAKAAQDWATVGAKLYWDDTAKVFTTTVGSNTLAGYVAAAAVSGDAKGLILLRQ